VFERSRARQMGGPGAFMFACMPIRTRSASRAPPFAADFWKRAVARLVDLAQIVEASEADRAALVELLAQRGFVERSAPISRRHAPPPKKRSPSPPRS
jgi:hypothetical protein